MLFSRQFPLRLLVLLSFTFAGAEVFAQSPEDLYRQAITALERGEQRPAQQALRQLHQKHPELFLKNNLDYLLARLQQRSGNLPAAAQLYQTVADRGSILAEYAWWHLAEISRAQKNLKTERDALVKLLGINPNSTLAPAAHRALAESYLADGDYPFAIAVLQSLAQTGTARGRDSMARLGEVYAKAGDNVRARETFNRLAGNQADDAALAAARGLDDLDRSEEREITEVEHLIRGRIYLANREFALARSHFAPIVEKSQNQKSLAEAMFAIGRSHYLEDSTDQAIEWYDRLHDRFPDSQEGEAAYYQVGHARQKAGLYRDAVRRYNEFITAYLKSQWLGGAYLNAIDSLRAAGLTTEALVWCRRAQDNPALAGDVSVVTAVFEEARVYLDQKKYDQALGVLNRLLKLNLSRSAPGSTSREEVQLLRGYCLEQMSEIERAMSVYLSIPSGAGSYWGERASQRLRALAKTDNGTAVAKAATRAVRAAKQAGRNGAWQTAREEASLALRLTDNEDDVRELHKILAHAYSRISAYRPAFSATFVSPARELLANNAKSPSDHQHATLGKELAFLGLYDEALPELTTAEPEVVGDVTQESEMESERTSFEYGLVAQRRRPFRKRAARSPVSGFSIALLAARNDRGDIAIKYGEPALRALPKDVVVAALPRNFAAIAYPLVHREQIVAEMGNHQFDPRLLLAIAKHESRFDPNAKSPAAARGLMQFTMATAMTVVPAADVKTFHLDGLYRPGVSIRLGAALLDKLGKQFPDNPFAIAAAYNASPEAVARWLARARDNDPDRFVAEIGYRETKEYVQRVMASFWVYSSLFSERLVERK